MLAAAPYGLLVGLQLSAALDIEAAGGHVPLGGDQPSELAATLAAVPSLELATKPIEGVPVFELVYFPRVFTRYPMVPGTHRPTLLHRLQLNWVPLLGRRNTIRSTSELTYGEIDSTITRVVFGTQQAQAPERTVLTLLRLDETVSYLHLFDRRTRFGFRVPVSYQTEVDAISDENPAVPTSRQVGAVPFVEHQITRRDTLNVQGSSLYTRFEESRLLEHRVQLGWDRQLTRRMRLQLTGGAARVDAKEGDDTLPPGYFGLGSAEMVRVRPLGSESVFLGLDARLDPIAQEVRPRGIVRLQSTTQVSRTVSFSTRGEAGTVISREPLPSDPNESLVSFYSAINWQASQSVGFRSGVRAFLSGPHWANELEVRERLILGFVGVHLSRDLD